MTNLPVNLPPIKAFEGASRTIRLDMYEGFVVPGQMAFEVWYNRAKQFEVTPTYNSSNRQLTATLTADQVKALPLIAELRVKFDSSYPFKAQIKPTTEGTDDGVVGYTIQQAGDSYTVIEIYAKDEIDAQVEVATEKANQTAADRIQTGLDRIAAESAALNAQTVALPSDLPPVNVKIVNVSTVGVYTNFSGISVTSGDLSSGLVQLRLENGTWKKVITPIDLAQYTQRSDFEQITSETPDATTDVTLPASDGYITTTNGFVSSSSWRASLERPVEEGDIITYNGIRPSGSGAALIGLDANKLNPVVLIAGTVTVGGQYTAQVQINSTIKFVSASYRATTGDVYSLSQFKPGEIKVKKEAVDGLQQDLNSISGVANSAGQKVADLVESVITNYAASIPSSDYGYMSSVNAFVASANFRAVKNLPVTPGQTFHYRGVRPNSTSGTAVAMVGVDANGLNPVILLNKTTTGFVQYETDVLIPAGVYMISACSRMLAGDVFELTLTTEKVKQGKIANSSVLAALALPKKYFMPSVGYGFQGVDTRMYPAGIFAMHPKDRSIDIIWNTNKSNEDFAEFTPGASDNNIAISLKTRIPDGTTALVGESILRVTHTVASPASPMNIMFIGDSLVYGVNATLTNGNTFQGAMSNEMSRRLTGAGTPLITGGPAALNLTNIYFRGTQGDQPVKHEGNSGWGIDTYLYSASRNSVVNKFYNAALSGSVKFDLNFYLSGNNFQAAQTTGGVDATGSNLVIYIMLGWNHVYNNTVSEAASWLGILMDTIHASHANAKVKLFGLNTPPEKIYKDNYSINTRNVSSESIMRDVIAYSEAWKAVADARSAWVEFLPVAPYFQPDGAYPTISKQNGLRGGSALSYATDYVHPNNVGYAQISDIAYYNFLYNYCRVS